MMSKHMGACGRGSRRSGWSLPTISQGNDPCTCNLVCDSKSVIMYLTISSHVDMVKQNEW